MDLLAQHVARGAGLVGDDGDLIADEFIQQAGLSGVGLAGDDDVQAFAKQRALARRRADGIEAHEDLRDAIAQYAAGSKIQFLVRKIDGRLHQRAQPGDLRLQIMHVRGEFSLHGTHGGARRRRAAGVDEISDGFGLGNIDLAVQKGAFAEFARPGHAAAQLEQPLQQRIEHPDPAVALQLQDMFAGVGGGSGKVQGQSTVERLAVGGEEMRNLRDARRRQSAR